MGTVATVFITSLLLNKQTAVEIEKEQNIRYIELKTTLYQQLLDLLEEMSILKKFTDKELVKLQFITHKLAVVASPEVIEEYKNFLNVLKKISRDRSFSGDTALLHESLGNLTLRIRKDILRGTKYAGYSESRVNEMIKENSRNFLLDNKSS